MASKACIFGCQTTQLTDAEKVFFKSAKPWGLILFARNINTPSQVKNLCDEFRTITANKNAPIFIDQEGGKIQRLRPPHWQDYPHANIFEKIYQTNKQAGKRAVYLLSRLHAFDLAKLNITVNCLPLLDIKFNFSHEIIASRAYSQNTNIIYELGKAACEGLLAGGILPVLKHIPGHGRAKHDSHLQLPIVDAPHSELAKTDFVPFAKLKNMPMAMTAHIIYKSLDAKNPATLSNKIIGEIIRNEIGFQNLLISDDICMKALAGSPAKITQSLFSAGCDILLHCNGELPQMQEVANHTPELAGESLERANFALAKIANIGNKDNEQKLRNEFNSLIRQN